MRQHTSECSGASGSHRPWRPSAGMRWPGTALPDQPAREQGQQPSPGQHGDRAHGLVSCRSNRSPMAIAAAPRASSALPSSSGRTRAGTASGSSATTTRMPTIRSRPADRQVCRIQPRTVAGLDPAGHGHLHRQPDRRHPRHPHPRRHCPRRPGRPRHRRPSRHRRDHRDTLNTQPRPALPGGSSTRVHAQPH
jgi:hypothetical protein